MKTNVHLFDSEDLKLCEESLHATHTEMKEHCLKHLSKLNPAVLYASTFTENGNQRLNLIKQELEGLDSNFQEFFQQKHFRLALQAQEMMRLALLYKENAN